jgi:membrane-bound metal-dependent hydrolase YbcI (DUF457 family)
VPPSRRVQVAALLFLLMIAGALAGASSLPPGWRTLTAIVTAALLWHPIRTLVFQRGRSAVRRLRWESDGRWSIVQGNGLWREVSLHPATAALGPWVVMVWSWSPPSPGGLEAGNCRSPSRPAIEGFRCYALIDAACVTPVTFRALRGRLKLDRRTRPERARRPRPGGN